MVTLRRCVRFGIAPGTPDHGSTSNGFGGSPSVVGLGAHYEIDVECAGDPDAITGYLINIKTIDRAVRSVAVPRILDQVRRDPRAEPSAMIADLADAIADALAVSVWRVVWRLTPTYAVEHEMETRTVLLTQQFDFAASHRLHVPTLSDEENRRLFGKCNHPSGHGHNYRVEPCIELEPGVQRFTLRDLERLTDEHIIEPFDHKHLNVDTIEFGANGLNPSVENIAKVCYERLAEAIDEHGGARLRRVTVWETDRTSATYPA